MKRFAFILILFVVMTPLSSCSEDGDGTNNEQPCGFLDPTNQLVFRFPQEDLTFILSGGPTGELSRVEATKAVLQKYYDLNVDNADAEDINALLETMSEVELCSCGGVSPVLVTFERAALDFGIETKLDNLKNEDGGDADVEGDLNFIFGIGSNEIPNSTMNFNLSGQGADGFESDSQNVIAILDTGIDLAGQYPDQSIIYNGAANSYINDSLPCEEVYDGLGWNFVDGNDNFFDDHQGIGHGTLVTKTLTNELELLTESSEPIDYSILPLKVFDSQGVGSYWNIVCAMAYINEIQLATSQDGSRGAIKLINASFGATSNPGEITSFGVMKSYIDDLSDSALFVASAGNCGEDTDASVSHLPSGYTSENIVAVGGYETNGNTIDKDPFSNFGTISIDVAAPFTLNEVEVNLLNSQSDSSQGAIVVSGTSFSAPLVSARLFWMMVERPDLSPLEIKSAFFTDFTSNNTNLDTYFAGGRVYAPKQK